MLKNRLYYFSAFFLLFGLILPTVFADSFLKLSEIYPGLFKITLGLSWVLSLFLFAFFKSFRREVFLYFALFFLGLSYSILYIFTQPKFLPAEKELSFSGVIYEIKEKETGTLVLIKSRELKRKILVFFPKKGFLEGNEIRVEGRSITPSDNYKKLIRSEGLSGAVIARNWQEEGKNWLFLVTSFREAFSNQIGKILPEPEASLALGTLIGKEGIFDRELNQKIRNAGVSHIVAVSGYNFILISGILLNFLDSLFGYLPALLLSLPFIFFYALSAGLTGSVKRALIFVLLIIFAKIQFRNTPAFYLLLVSFIIASILNPFTLLFDFSFLLSALAASGLLILGPRLNNLFDKLKLPSPFSKTASETLSASLFVSPITTFVFGQNFLKGLVANLLIVPLVPLVMLFTSIGVFLSTLSSFLIPLATILVYSFTKLIFLIIEFFA